MTTLEIIIVTLLTSCLMAMFFYIFWIHHKQRTTQQGKEAIGEQEKISQAVLMTKIDAIQKELAQTSHKISGDSGKQTEILRSKIEKIQNELARNQEISQERGKSLNEKMEKFNQIFLSSYRRGKLGEMSLEFILNNILAENSEFVKKQYTMTNNHRPDVFLSFPKCNIPIDSKFPYDNFVKILQEDEKSINYQPILKDLKNNIEKHIKDVARKYISSADKTEQAIIYFPSQALFEFIYGNLFFEKTLLLANDNKVVLAGPNILPVVIRMILTFIIEEKRTKNIQKILKNLDLFGEEFARFSERWTKLENRIEGLHEDSKKLSITQKKITGKFKNITDSNQKLEAGK